MKRISLGLLVASILLIFSSCPTPTTTISITNVGWLLDNIDPSYWSGTPPTQHAFLNFDLGFAGDILAASDIASVKVTAPNSWHWDESSSSLFVDLQNKRISLPYIWDGGYAPDRLQIGTYSSVVTLVNSQTSSTTLLVPAPNSTTTGTYTTVYTEDIAAPADSAPLVRRATLGTHSNNGTTLIINFTVNDSKVYNGYVWLYDASNAAVGYSKTTFRDSANGNILPILNGGGAYNTNGTTNTVTLTNADITYSSGKSYSDISKFIVVLTDGAQYAAPGRYSSYDCRSISAKTTF
jgi:hypothetical protein